VNAQRKPATCCTSECAQGRRCVIRQACELPEPTPTRALGLRTLWLHASRWYFEQARKQMSPLHSDLPHVVQKLRAIERELQGLAP
jgi:hypothetical protein